MVNAVAPHITVEPLMKPLPVTASVKPAAPAAAEDGLSEAMAGVLTVNLDAPDEPLLVFLTVTLTVPAETSCALVTAAVSDVALL